MAPSSICLQHHQWCFSTAFALTLTAALAGATIRPALSFLFTEMAPSSICLQQHQWSFSNAFGLAFTAALAAVTLTLGLMSWIYVHNLLREKQNCKQGLTPAPLSVHPKLPAGGEIDCHGNFAKYIYDHVCFERSRVPFVGYSVRVPRCLPKLELGVFKSWWPLRQMGLHYRCSGKPWHFLQPKRTHMHPLPLCAC